MAPNNQTKKTELAKLLEEYPDMDYHDGFFYPDENSDDYITVDANNADPVNADELIEDHIFWSEKLSGTGVDAKKFIEDNFKSYKEAFKSI